MKHSIKEKWTHRTLQVASPLSIKPHLPIQVIFNGEQLQQAAWGLELSIMVQGGVAYWCEKTSGTKQISQNC